MNYIRCDFIWLVRVLIKVKLTLKINSRGQIASYTISVNVLSTGAVFSVYPFHMHISRNFCLPLSMHYNFSNYEFT